MKKLLKIIKRERANSGMPIWLTIICIAPVGHLILEIIDNETRQILLKTAIISFFTIILATLFWIDYFINKRKKKESLADYEVCNGQEE